MSSNGNYNNGNYNNGHYNNGHYNNGSYNNGNYNNGYSNNGDRNNGDRNNGYCNNGYCNNGHFNNGNFNNGNFNNGHYNNGHYNNGDRHLGHFNTIKPTIRLFNKDTDYLYNDYWLPSCLYNRFVLTEWVPECEMIAQEKKDNKHFYVTKGYLKVYSYKDAWKNMWAKLTDEEKEQIKSIPNFDAMIFHEVTGIDVTIDLSKQKNDMIKQAEDLIKAGRELLNRAKGICD